MPPYEWDHLCMKVPGKNFGIPSLQRRVDIDRCLYCGEISPRKQKETDAEAAAVLLATDPNAKRTIEDVRKEGPR